MRYDVTTLDPAKGREVHAGWYDDETKTYTRWVDIKKHLCLKHRGYGVQKDVYDALLEKGCQHIQIMFNKENFCTASIERWIDHGVVDDIGNGLQVFLADYLMDRVGSGDSV